MPTTMLITNNAPDRVRGFLASCMGEVSPGVYVAPKMTPGVRERIWRVMEEWHQDGGDRSVVLVWPEAKEPGGLAIRALGKPRYELHEVDDLTLVRRPLTAADEAILEAIRARDARASRAADPDTGGNAQSPPEMGDHVPVGSVDPPGDG